MSHITTVGIDLAKRVFQLHGSNASGETILTKRISDRATFSRFMANLPPCVVGMEACGGAYYWARLFKGYGHQVKLMHPKYVKAYVQRNKTDVADAKACHEAVLSRHLQAIPIKDEEQQAIFMLHKVRSRLIKQRTQLGNQIRGCLLEFGFIIPQGESALLKRLPEILCQESILPDLTHEMIGDLLEEYHELKARTKKYDQKLVQIAKTNPHCQRLCELRGVGPVTATAFVAALKGYSFETGRQASAFLGLTPRESSSGNTRRLLGISKQGNCYLRSLFIHGARSVVQQAEKKEDALSRWIKERLQKSDYNQAVVALANKTARMAWSILKHERVYDKDFASYYKHAA